MRGQLVFDVEVVNTFRVPRRHYHPGSGAFPGWGQTACPSADAITACCAASPPGKCRGLRKVPGTPASVTGTWMGVLPGVDKTAVFILPQDEMLPSPSPAASERHFRVPGEGPGRGRPASGVNAVGGSGVARGCAPELTARKPVQDALTQSARFCKEKKRAQVSAWRIPRYIISAGCHQRCGSQAADTQRTVRPP